MFLRNPSKTVTAEKMKLRALVSCQSISSTIVGLPNAGEKDVKGLLFHKQQRNGRRLSAPRNWISISKFVVSLPNSSEKGVKGMLSSKQRLNGRRFSVFEIGIAIQTSCVSLPNLSEKDVKGLLSRKQPLHTSPNRLKEGNEKKSLSLP